MNTSKLTQVTTRKTSVALRISEKIVDDVITHQWKTAYEAYRKEKSIEISGLGRFDIREKQVVKKMELYEKYKTSYEKKMETLQDGPEKEKLQKKLDTAIEDINYLKSKLK